MSDRGGEYRNTQVAKVLKELNIQHIYPSLVQS